MMMFIMFILSYVSIFPFLNSNFHFFRLSHTVVKDNVFVFFDRCHHCVPVCTLPLSLKVFPHTSICLMRTVVAPSKDSAINIQSQLFQCEHLLFVAFAHSASYHFLYSLLLQNVHLNKTTKSSHFFGFNRPHTSVASISALYFSPIPS